IGDVYKRQLFSKDDTILLNFYTFGILLKIVFYYGHIYINQIRQMNGGNIISLHTLQTRGNTRILLSIIFLTPSFLSNKIFPLSIP
ncbi:MAG: hypothetical protein KGD67_12500, partial [Candidatus Lokiarchaeota archaeon]|nr:hypothetical protein [Candidatus Lokiarchaeota archaeon]